MNLSLHQYQFEPLYFSSLLGGIGRTLEELTFGGARPVTKTGQGIMDLIQGQDAERAMGGYETFDGKKM